MVVGMFIAGLAFVVAGFVQLAVQNAQVNLKAYESKAVFVNTLPSEVQFNITGMENTSFFLAQGEVRGYLYRYRQYYVCTQRVKPFLAIRHP